MKLNYLQRFLASGEAHLTSPALIQSSATCRIFFWYYFYALYKTEFIYVYFDSGHQTACTEIFRLEGDHEKSWRRAEVVIGRIQNRFKVRIVGRRESTIAAIDLDDISFENCYIQGRVEDF
ncbi:MAM and LDL-receptor class A domain-containing protein 2 [Caerostris darwini]|uniref:MAM and LDL-receptor class A domain-containing protein 2 n=1 Tax=Caerostris darwini TaxID=1538125 RepID=A0AAV4WAQ2_9ARAC|nr:MAM and LDL-receptor class A domain-containing protein 2 [Caerostris darwini]